MKLINKICYVRDEHIRFSATQKIIYSNSSNSHLIETIHKFLPNERFKAPTMLDSFKPASDQFQFLFWIFANFLIHFMHESGEPANSCKSHIFPLNMQARFDP